METQETTSTTGETKQITIDVPAERLPEFYAFFAHFLARGEVGRQHRGRRGHYGHRGHHGRHCGGHRQPGEEEAQTSATTEQAETATA